MLYLEDSKFLVRRCCLSGKLEDKIFLSNTLKFNEIVTEPESGIITLTSTKDTTDGGAVFTIAVFSSPPLKFVAMFEVCNASIDPIIVICMLFYVQVKSSIFGFGKKIQHVDISHGLILITYYDRHDKNEVSMFSLDTILSKVYYTSKKYRRICDNIIIHWSLSVSWKESKTWTN
jgi:DDB1- and CUL4-associated factor 17